MIEIQGITKRYGSKLAVDDVTFTIQKGEILGFLGRNGAGKTTMLSILAAQIFQSTGDLRLFGQKPHENIEALKKLCFVRENAPFPKAMRVREVLSVCSDLYPNWDNDYAKQLLDTFSLNPKKKFKQLSRGMESSLGLVVGLASRAELTVFDEPSLGLDAVARERFYSEILREMEAHPRTVIISTHLIDEVSQLFEDVVIIDKGHVLTFQPLQELLGTAVMLSGPEPDVKKAAANYSQIHEESLAGVSVATVLLGGKPRPTDADFENIKVSPVPLQKLFVYMTEGVASI